ncbi:MAG: hypothetical protein GC162_12785 [Planctomycetes bacterium]|nr:hypothetical protein [Planctomycetota bacterium]
MAVSGVGESSTTSAGVSNRYADLSSEDFLKIIMTELQSQDPLSPQDSSKLLDQISSLRNIESQLKLNDNLQAMVLQNQVSSAGGLIGKVVAGLDANNNKVGGLVSSVRVVDDNVMLELDTGQTISMDRVTDIADASILNK